MRVVKFGGTSIQDAAAIRRAAGVVDGKRAEQPIVVVSALAGVTDALLAIAGEAAEGQRQAADGPGRGVPNGAGRAGAAPASDGSGGPPQAGPPPMPRPDLSDPVQMAERHLLQVALQYPLAIVPEDVDELDPGGFRAAMHRAYFDYDPDEDRLLYRVLVRGEVPENGHTVPIGKARVVREGGIAADIDVRPLFNPAIKFFALFVEAVLDGQQPEPPDVRHGRRDEDGVVVIPDALVAEVLERAEEIVRMEQEARKLSAEGMTAAEMLEKFGHV